jgi:hypothetical protein
MNRPGPEHMGESRNSSERIDLSDCYYCTPRLSASEKDAYLAMFFWIFGLGGVVAIMIDAVQFTDLPTRAD